MGSLNKKIFARFADTGCLRQLLLYLCAQDDQNGWQREFREIIDLPPPSPVSSALLRRGRRYEQKVYQVLRALDPSGTRVRAHCARLEGETPEVVAWPVQPEELRQIAAAVAGSEGLGSVVLLEHQVDAPVAGFQDRILGRRDGVVPVLKPAQALRPDLVVIGQPARVAGRRAPSLPLRALEASGEVVEVQGSDRLAINLVDCKNTNADQIGRRHFSELLFYAHAFAAYLETHGLADRLFVHADGMGIIPLRSDSDLAALERVEDLVSLVVPLAWDDHHHIYTHTVSSVQRLRRRVPLEIEAAPVRLQAACSRCRFFHDCIRGLGYTGVLGESGGDPRNWGVELIPYTSPALAAQLRRFGLGTVGQVAQQIMALELDSVPSPLYSMRPLLALKARALVENRPVYAHEWAETDTRGRRLGSHLSTALPRSTDLALVFNAEYEPTYGLVFAVGLHLEAVTPRNTAHGPLCAAWWQLWSQALPAHAGAEEALETVWPELRSLLAEPPGGGISAHVVNARSAEIELEDWLEQRVRPMVLAFAESLWALSASVERPGSLLKIGPTPDPAGGSVMGLRYQWSQLCGGVRREDEQLFAIEVLVQLHRLLALCRSCEELLGVHPIYGTRRGSRRQPTMAGFYWSRDQLQHLQDLLERHLMAFFTQTGVPRCFYDVICILAPSGSEIQPHRQFQKLYDIRAFVESSVGLPGQPINYTWHAIVQWLHERGELRMRTGISREYWPHLFNYMEFSRWHDWLDPESQELEPDRDWRHELLQETARKTWSLQLLMRRFQLRGRQSSMLARGAGPIPTASLTRDPIEAGRGAGVEVLNPLARLWALSSRLKGAVQKMDADEIRLSFPARGIGRLAAAAIEDPRPLPTGRVLGLELREDGFLDVRFRLGHGAVAPRPSPKPRPGKERRPPALCLMPLADLHRRPARTGVWVHGEPRELARDILEITVELVPGHPALQAVGQPGDWCLVQQEAGLIELSVRGMSANMNIQAGRWCLLVPQHLRDAAVLDAMRVEVRQVSWLGDRAQPGYRILVWASAQRYPVRASPPYFSLPPSGWREPWYIYPHATDIWSGRLFANRGDNLLSRDNLGQSWLGLRRSLLCPQLREAVWSRLLQTDQLTPPSEVHQRELVLYAPELLPRLEESAGPLQTTRHPSPDPSQREAIQMALSHQVACILGPPGTGKSETIAALVDEFVHRAGRPVRILITTFAYAPLREVLDKVRTSRDATGQLTRAAQQRLVFLRSARQEWLRPRPGLPSVTDLVMGRTRPLIGTVVGEGPDAVLEQERLPLYTKVDDHLGDGFILFANPHQLFRLGARQSKSGRSKWMRPDFAFDLIVVDEASQMPVDQLLPALAFLRDGTHSLRVRPLSSDPLSPQSVQDTLAAFTDVTLDDENALGGRTTHLVLVGDHHQLPPVQPIQPPEPLRVILGSLFGYYLTGQPPGAELPSCQLSINYRSDPQIVEFTRTLQQGGVPFYQNLRSYWQDHERAPLPRVPDAVAAPELRSVLDPQRVVGTLIHEREDETLLSMFEASLTARLIVAFFLQWGVHDAVSEEDFWRERIGVVAPHNAHGRVIRRLIHRALSGGSAPRSFLAPGDLMRALEQSVYTVEKFQGSARNVIIASMACSAPDQLSVEDRFLYDLCRFNVLTSRARQKMLLICSRNFLSWVPRDREVVGWAARIREYALRFCDRSEQWQRAVPNERGGLEPMIEWRWHASDADGS